MTEALDPLTLPMQGSQLIEASAGTGKTWTIAALYVRLVLGHGCTPRSPGEILVMTFTKAATRELSDRIRRRLVQAAACFRDDPAGQVDDFLVALKAAFPAGPERQQAVWRLAMAAEVMDDAAVHTIDAWCQRMLREHAFDSGCLFDEELQPQEASVRAEAVRDYWRQQVYPLDDETLEAVLARWKDVEALGKDVEKLLSKQAPAQEATAGDGSLAEVVRRTRQQRRDMLATLKQGWVQRADDMQDWLATVWTDKKHPARKLVPGQANATRWIETLRCWAADETLEQLDLKTGATRLSHGDLQSRFVEAGVSLDIPDCFAQLEALLLAIDALPDPNTPLRLHAAARVYGRMQQIKVQAGTFGFADMLHRLDTALDEPAQGAKAQRLRQRILAQYPVALIDEFQDTSPVQLRIFDRLYGIEENETSRGLLLIGDPKQAIYGFRGADIYSYLVARKRTEGRHHVLGTNHRSTKALVGAVNAMFGAAESRPGEGAFMFRQAGNAASDVPFVEVQAKGRAQRLVTAAGEVSAVTLAMDTVLRNKADSLRLYAALCAERIVTLLNDPQAGFTEEGKPFVRLRPSDIAVLVRTGREADAVRQEMRRRNLASVYLSDKDTVFQTAEAADLLRLLQAVASPREVRLARAALATPLLGLSLRELVALATHDVAFDRQLALLQELSQVWKAQGVLAMVRRALHAFDLPARWLSGQDPGAQGERRLTNVLHLAELLQAASAQAKGEHVLLRWLQQQIADSGSGLGGGDDRVLRLESDADLVQVVTLHKSKGLEYPLVFLPFPAHFREIVSAGEREADAVLLQPNAERSGGQSELVLAPTKAELAVAEKERQREDLRLLYVAITRAQHALWVGASGLQSGKSKEYLWHRSAIGYVLSGPEDQVPEQRLADMLALAQRCGDVAIEQLPLAENLPLPATSRLRAREALPALVVPPAYHAQFDRSWSISSYSALVRDAAWGPDGSGTVPARMLRDDEPDEAMGLAAARAQTGQAWHRFPRGAFAGNFLHDQLEWLAQEHFALDESETLQKTLLRRCERQGWGHRAEEVLAWLRQVCTTPLPDIGAPLSALCSTVPEMEFWMPSDGMTARRVDELCQQHVLPGRARPQLPERALQGMLMGFADLVFERGGRYWVLDYKSNALGSNDGDYTPQAMNAAMLEHRYDVQASLYLLALHRLLRARLGVAYEPARQLGGAIYFFIRGIQNSATAGCCTVASPHTLIEALDAMLPLGTASLGASTP